MTPNDTDETDETNETNRTDEPTECEYCGERFDGERALYDHWYHADPEGHDLDDEIGALQRAIVSEDRRLATITEGVAQRCDRLAQNPTGARPDLRSDQGLDLDVWCREHRSESLRVAIPR